MFFIWKGFFLVNGNSKYVSKEKKLLRFFFGCLTMALLLTISLGCNSAQDQTYNTHDEDGYQEDSDQRDSAERVDLSEYPEIPLPQLEPLSEGEEIALLHTSKGVVTLRFFPDFAPMAVQNFKTHAKAGYYDGVLFHAVTENSIIQSGDPDGTGLGGVSIWGGPFEIETTPSLRHLYGALSMVRNIDPNSQGSQFFIVVNRELEESVSREIESYKEIQDHVVGQMADGSPFPMAMYFPERVIDEYQTVGGIPGLDMTYTVFGHVIDGFDVIDSIASVETSQDEDTLDKPLEDIVIERITFENFSSN